MKEEPDVLLINKHLRELGEHFDAVQIFASRYEPELEDGTVNVSCGAGNWFARYGQIREWILRQDEFGRERSRREYGT